MAEAGIIEDVPLWVNLFGPFTQIGRVQGLCVDLPNLDEAETEALWQLPDDQWKEPFEGSVADAMRNGDPDRMRLMNYQFEIASYDREEGIKFFTTVASLVGCLTSIESLGDKGVRLCDPEFMGEYGAETGSFVWVS